MIFLNEKHSHYIRGGMKEMKKLAGVFSVLMLLFVLSACGAEEEKKQKIKLTHPQ